MAVRTNSSRLVIRVVVDQTDGGLVILVAVQAVILHVLEPLA
jgi:hypothetical protein